MEEDIKILEEFIKDYNASYPEEKEWVAIYPNQIEAIENLIKGYRELEEGYDKLAKHFVENHIPKSKIKEFVEEHKWNLSETEYSFASTVVDVDELLKFMEDK